MRRVRIAVQPGAVLAAGTLIFLLKPGELLALCLAAAVHELGHLAALALLGSEVSAISLELTGLRIFCVAPESACAACFAALAGPLAGVGLFFILRGVGLSQAAEISLWLSAINLLPVLPLDGGRALLAALERLCGGTAARKTLAALGFAVPVALMALGLAALRAGYGLALTAYGGALLLLWLLDDL